MEPIDFWQVFIVVMLLLIVFSRRDLDAGWQQLRRELKGDIPVHSAQTTQGTEAEFIRDRLPRRYPKTTILLCVVLTCVVTWMLSR